MADAPFFTQNLNMDSPVQADFAGGRSDQNSDTSQVFPARPLFGAPTPATTWADMTIGHRMRHAKLFRSA